MSRVANWIRRYLHDRKNYRFFIKNYVELGELQRAADVMNTLRHAQILRADERNPPAGSAITIIAPHPDDEIMGPGGALILAIRAGCRVHVVFLTDGDTLTRVRDTNPAKESRVNAQQLGYSTEFLQMPTGNISLDQTNLQQLATAINRQRADYLWLPFLLDDHDDHRRASHLVMLAAQAGLISGAPPVWAYQVYTSLPANVIVDITTVANAKRDAIRRYVSQNPIRDWAHYVLGLNAYNTRFLSGNAQERYAETFFALPFNAYVELCAEYFRDPAGLSYLRQNYTH